MHTKQNIFIKLIDFHSVNPRCVVTWGGAKLISAGRVSRVCIRAAIRNEAPSLIPKLEAQAIVMGMTAISAFHPDVCAGDKDMGLVRSAENIKPRFREVMRCHRRV